MMYTILVSKTFLRQFTNLESSIREKIRLALRNLETDPFKSRSGTDIKRLSHTRPTKYRLRVGTYRIIYVVENKTVKVLEVFKRGKEYRNV
ncbi:MAG: type II toxin-antitoxin system RelE/ParE family toxin [Theionarchaea archaeon]|nr:type II toxin-antitoxin system RelE/ParE family toxin [Theionarchaea archaeon]